MDENICGTTFTIRWLEEVLRAREARQLNVKLAAWSAERIGVGKGFLSILARVKLDWRGVDANLLPASVVLKTPTLESIQGDILDGMKMDEQRKSELANEWLTFSHGNEVTAYELFANAVPFPTPKYLHGCLMTPDGPPADLLLEDLHDKGATANIADGLRVEQLLPIVDAIADLHAYSMRTTGWADGAFRLQPRESFDTWPTMFDTVAKQLAEMKPEYFDGHIEKFRWAFEVDFIYDTMVLNKGSTSRNVLVHGDLWTNNIMFEQQADGAAGDRLLALIDWQLSHPGSVAEDLCRVLVSSCDAGLRRRETPGVLRRYHERLRRLLAPHEPPYSLADVQTAFERVLPFAAAFYVIGVPLMCNSPAVCGGPDASERVENMLVRAKCAIEDALDARPTNALE